MRETERREAGLTKGDSFWVRNGVTSLRVSASIVIQIRQTHTTTHKQECAVCGTGVDDFWFLQESQLSLRLQQISDVTTGGDAATAGEIALSAKPEDSQTQTHTLPSAFRTFRKRVPLLFDLVLCLTSQKFTCQCRHFLQSISNALHIENRVHVVDDLQWPRCFDVRSR